MGITRISLLSLVVLLFAFTACDSQAPAPTSPTPIQQATTTTQAQTQTSTTPNTNTNWEILVASGAVIFSVISYVLTRKRELVWKRTEFLFAQAQYFDVDPDLVETVKILEERHDSIVISQIFSNNTGLDIAKKNEYIQKFDKLLNFLWRLCYAYLETKTISQKEIEAFSWYFWRIAQYPSVIEYCNVNGFEEINIVINKLDYIKEMRKLLQPLPNKEVI